MRKIRIVTTDIAVEVDGDSDEPCDGLNEGLLREAMQKGIIVDYSFSKVSDIQVIGDNETLWEGD